MKRKTFMTFAKRLLVMLICVSMVASNTTFQVFAEESPNSTEQSPTPDSEEKKENVTDPSADGDEPTEDEADGGDTDVAQDDAGDHTDAGDPGDSGDLQEEQTSTNGDGTEGENSEKKDGVLPENDNAVTGGETVDKTGTDVEADEKDEAEDKTETDAETDGEVEDETKDKDAAETPETGEDENKDDENENDEDVSDLSVDVECIIVPEGSAKVEILENAAVSDEDAEDPGEDVQDTEDPSEDSQDEEALNAGSEENDADASDGDGQETSDTEAEKQPVKVVFSVTAEEGYEIVSVTANGEELTSEDGKYSVQTTEETLTVTVNTEATESAEPEETAYTLEDVTIGGMKAVVTVKTEDPNLIGAVLVSSEEAPTSETLLEDYLKSRSENAAEVIAEYPFDLHFEKTDEEGNTVAVEPAEGYPVQVEIKFDEPLSIDGRADFVDLIHYVEDENGEQTGIEALDTLYEKPEEAEVMTVSLMDLDEEEEAEPILIDEISFTAESFSTMAVMAIGLDEPVSQEGDGWSLSSDNEGYITVKITKAQALTAEASVTNKGFHAALFALKKKDMVKTIVIDLEEPAPLPNTYFTYIKSSKSYPELEIVKINNATSVDASKGFYNLKELEITNVSGAVKTMVAAKNGFKEDGKLTLRNCGSVDGFSGITNLSEVTLENVRKINKSAFAENKQLISLNITSGDITGGQIDSNAFANCNNLQTIIMDLKGYSLLQGKAFDNVADLSGENLPMVSMTNYDKTDLGYSNLFFAIRDTELGQELNARMRGLLANRFSLNAVEKAPDLAERSEEWSKQLGAMNDDEDAKAHLNKAARWIDANRTTAQVAFDFNYTPVPGRDFLFVIDYSDSITQTASGYDDSRYYNMISKVMDVSEKLLTAQDYDNRVGLVFFGSETVASQPFTNDFNAIQNYLVDSVYPPTDTSTHYSTGFTEALNVIKSAIQEVELIFISDGAPSATDNYTDLVNAVKATGTDVYTVLQGDNGNPGSTVNIMRDIATNGLFFSARDCDSFSQAVNDAIDAVVTGYELRDVVNPAFTLKEDTIQVLDDQGSPVPVQDYTLSFDVDADGNTVIICDLRGEPYRTYSITYEAALNQVNGAYPYGDNFETNLGDATLCRSGDSNTVNAVASPVLGRPAPVQQPTDPDPTPQPDDPAPTPDTPAPAVVTPVTPVTPPAANVLGERIDPAVPVEDQAVLGARQGVLGVRTGDEAPVIPLFAFMAVSAVLAGAVVIKRKKSR